MSVSTFGQMVGTFDYGSDGRLYLFLQNSTSYPLVFNGSVYSPSTGNGNSEVCTVQSGGIIYLGPTTPWKWQWRKGDIYTVKYANGYVQSWVCSVTDVKPYNPSFRNRPSFVKTKFRCDKCSCSGYWGYRHDNGTYEGNCSNTDSWGHTCGHSPQHHGLQNW